MRSSLLATVTLLVGCAEPATLQTPPMSMAVVPPPVIAPQTFPDLVVASPGTEILATGPQQVLLARPRSRLPLKITRTRPDGWVQVTLEGGIEVSGLVSLDSLGVMVCEAGPISDRLYAGHSNLLQLRSPVTAGRVKVAGVVILRERAYAKDLPFSRQFRRLALKGEIETRRLCRSTPPPKHAGTKADPTIIRALGEVYEDDFPSTMTFVTVEREVALTLHDRPGGTSIYTRPADSWGYTLARLRRKGGWDLVAAGSGPYVVGWTPTRPERKPSKASKVFGLLGGLMGTTVGPWLLNSKKLRGLPLHALAAGTEIQQFGQAQARLTRPGFARASTLKDGWRYVSAAVDEDVVVHGWVEQRALGPEVKAEAAQ